MSLVDQEKLLDLKEQADEYYKSANSDAKWKISDEKLVWWFKVLLDLTDKTIAIEDIIQRLNVKELENYKSNHPSAYVQATKIKRDLKKVLLLFYSIFPFMYEKLFNKRYSGSLPSII